MHNSEISMEMFALFNEMTRTFITYIYFVCALYKKRNKIDKEINPIIIVSFRPKDDKTIIRKFYLIL